MSIYVNIHRTHRQLTNGHERIPVEGRTIGECLEALIGHYPGLAKVLFNQNKDLRGHLEIYLNMESAYPDELKKKVSDGDEIYITALLSGG